MKNFIQTNILDKNGKVYSKKIYEEWFIKNGYEQQYQEIIEKTSFLDSPTFSQRLYHIINDIDKKILCLHCKLNSPQFNTFKTGYRTFCSNSCQAEHNKEKRKQTILDTYGEYPNLSDSAVQKRKQTCLEKYGVEFPFQNKEIQDKQTQTMISLYGVENPSKLQEVKNKKIETCLQNWGTDHPIKSQEIQEKIKKFNLETYGVEYFFKTEKFKESIADYTFPTQSVGETEIFEFIKSIVDCDVEQGNRYVLNGKELDIFIKDKNIAIEYCGLYWHSNKFRGNNYHKEKFDSCKNQGIRLITIFEDEWKYNKHLVKIKLSHILNRNNTKKVFARKCNIKIVSNKEKSEFHNKYHIQGDGNSSINIGLYFNNELVSCMSFKKRNLQIFELDRYTTKYSVVGGFTRLLNYFKKSFVWDEIITFADLRWHFGDVYQTSNFKIDKTLNPDYYYIINNKRIHKFNFRKESIKKKFPDLYDESLSETQNMNNIGILKIYDCGKIRFKLTNIN